MSDDINLQAIAQLNRDVSRIKKERDAALAVCQAIIDHEKKVSEDTDNEYINLLIDGLIKFHKMATNVLESVK